MHIIVHGGAGPAPEESAARQRVVAAAAEAGRDADEPLDAVCAALHVLEADPKFNAGTGSAVQSDGVARTDASVMRDDGTAGAACAMSGVEHAADVARAVATETPHVLLAGERAVDFAAAMGVATDCNLWTERTRERWQEADPPDGGLDEQLSWVRDRYDLSGQSTATDHDTVGAVATDGDRLAAATSTGGRWFALAGRVGDVPQLGAGVYVDERGGASATGEGEPIARFGLAKAAVAALDTYGPHQAAAAALADFEDETGGSAGVVVLDHAGHRGSAANTESMQTATR